MAPHSSDVTYCDNFLGGQIKGKVHLDAQHDPQDLKNKIRRKIVNAAHLPFCV